MKFLTTELTYLLSQRETRRNLAALAKVVLLVVIVVAVYAVLFHFIMLYEGQDHSWITGVYWALTVMSTLGFGDITFASDLGRAFSILVLMSGIVLLLIVLPFAFIRFFYAPWLEAQVRTRAPRQVPEDTAGHVILCAWDPLAQGLAQRLEVLEIPYWLIEPDPATAAHRVIEGIPVVTGPVDARETYAGLRTNRARAVLVNLDDAGNTNITLTIREESAEVPILAVAENVDSIDILELAGANRVLALKQRLGEQLAHRINAGHAEAHVVGRFADLAIAEIPVRDTPLAGRRLRDTRLRETFGVNVVGLWHQGEVIPVGPDTVIGERSLVVVAGTDEQIAALDELLVIYAGNWSPVLVIGGGKVGESTLDALTARGQPVHLVEKDPVVAARLEQRADRVVVGDAADREVLERAGLGEAPAVILTTNDDAINVYLAVYCRRLRPEMTVVSRITHPRNVEAIHRAGADLVLSAATLGIEAVVAQLQGRDLTVLGENVSLFTVPVPRELVGESLAAARVGERTGLLVLAIETREGLVTGPGPDDPLPPACRLLAVGTTEQRQLFDRVYD